MQKIAVFGASGRTGKLFTELALKNGYEVQALVRDPPKLGIQHSNLYVIQGDIYDPGDVAETINKAEAVISFFGPGKGSPPNPVPTAIRNILSAMQQHNVERLIVLSSLPFGLIAGIFVPEDKPRFMSKLFINKFTILITKALFGGIVKDQQAYVDLIRQSPFRWTLVRAPALNNQPSISKYRVGYLDADLGKNASRSDVAAFVLDVLMNEKYIRQMPIISSRSQEILPYVSSKSSKGGGSCLCFGPGSHSLYLQHFRPWWSSAWPGTGIYGTSGRTRGF